MFDVCLGKLEWLNAENSYRAYQQLLISEVTYILVTRNSDRSVLT